MARNGSRWDAPTEETQIAGGPSQVAGGTGGPGPRLESHGGAIYSYPPRQPAASQSSPFAPRAPGPIPGNPLSASSKFDPQANLYVYGFPPEWDEAQLAQLFTPYGEIVSTKIGRDLEGKSKCYGFVAYTNSTNALVAIQNLHGSSVGNGKMLTVRVKEDGPGAFSSSKFAPEANLYVNGIPTDWGEAEVQNIFVPYGNIVSMKVDRDEQGKGRGYGFVAFADVMSAQMAISALNGAFLNETGQQLTVAVNGAGRENKGKIDPEANLYVYGFPPDWTEETLERVFSPYGQIISMKVGRSEQGNSKCFGFVAYADSISAQQAISALHEAPVGNNQTLVVRVKDAPGSAPAREPRQHVGQQQQQFAAAPVPNAHVGNCLGHSGGGIRPGASALGGVTPGVVGVVVPPPSGKGKATGDVGPGTGTRAEPGCSAYVSYMPLEWDEEEIKRKFQHCGTIVSVYMFKTPEGAGKGVACVTFSSPASVMKAVFSMSGFVAAPRRFLDVSPRKGEEQFVPTVPDIGDGRIFPPPGNPKTGPTGNWNTPPGCTIVVNNVPRDWTEVEMYYHFTHFGQISNIKEPMGSGNSCVAFEDPLSAVRAIKAMNGFNASDNCYLEISPYQGEEHLFIDTLASLVEIPDYLHSARSSPKQVTQSANLHVSGFPAEWTEQDLYSQFSQFGTIASLKVVKNPDGSNAGYGFVSFEEAEKAAAAAEALNDFVYDGGKLVVKVKDTWNQGNSNPDWPTDQGGWQMNKGGWQRSAPY